MIATNNRSAAATVAKLHLTTSCPALGFASVAVVGEVDMATAAALRAALMDALATHNPDVLEVDLSACSFMDCSGAHVLVAVRSSAAAMGCLVWARYPQPLVRLVFEVTGLLASFTAPADADAAAATAAAPGARRRSIARTANDQSADRPARLTADSTTRA